MGLLSKAFKSLRKLGNFLSLGVVKKTEEWLFPGAPPKAALTIDRQGSDKTIPVVYGQQKVGAIKVHKFVTDGKGGAKNEFLHLICVFCEGEIEEIGELFFGDLSENDKQFKKKKGGRWYRKSVHLGSANQAADPDAVAEIANWTSEHKLDGLAYVYLRIEIDKKQQVWRGEPDVTAIVKGKKLYDPRTKTNEYSSNPALCLRDYLRNPIYGKGLSSGRMIDSLFIIAANFCDKGQTVEETLEYCEYDQELGRFWCRPTSTQTKIIPKFTCNLLIDTSKPIIDNVREIQGTFRAIIPPTYNIGPIIETGGSPIGTIGPNDIVGDVSVSAGDVNDRFNRVIIKFPNVNANYEIDEAFYPALSNPINQIWLDEDNGKLLEKKFYI